MAMKSLEDQADFKVTWKPYFLNPNTPKEGIPLVEYITSKYGAEMGKKTAEGKGPLTQVGQQLGIEFTRSRLFVNTMKSHCLLEMAKSAGKQDAVAEVLFHIYFEQGSDINSNDVLFKVARDTGLPEDELKRCLDDANLHDSINREVRHAQQKGINGVPFFDIYIDGVNNAKPFSFSGAQDAEVIAGIFKKLLNLKSKA